ncbi:MAG TPA: DUF58 domain-containing protein, partial [Arthrobacter sp.]|nr:DUF58 domain-containing protein [Arthrobacter sp.]
MALSGRFVVLALLGLLPVLLLPGWWTVLVVIGVLAVLLGLELSLAASLRSVDVQRQDPGHVPLNGVAHSVLTVRNQGPRRLR